MKRTSILIAVLVIASLVLVACGEAYDVNYPNHVRNNSGCLTDQSKADKWLADNGYSAETSQSAPTEEPLTKEDIAQMIAEALATKQTQSAVPNTEDHSQIVIINGTGTDTASGPTAGSDNQQPSNDSVLFVGEGAPAPVQNGCPPAIEVAPGSAFNEFTFVDGYYYHLNLSLEGAPAGIEGNLFFKVKSTFSLSFDGAAWEYQGPITTTDCQFFEETSGDKILTLDNVPQLNGLIEVLMAPNSASFTTTLPVHKLVVTQ